jgi:superfamily I DNA/RNA helicase
LRWSNLGVVKNLRISSARGDDEIVPLQERIETVGDDADLQEVYDTERHLLYVACNRAETYLLITSVEPPSEFLDDLRT